MGVNVSSSKPLDLAGLRSRKGISLEQVAESTKISMYALRAIEALEFKKLPGGIYSTNYIRQYARCVKCDERQLLSLYQAAVGTPEPNPVARESRSGWMRFLADSWAPR